MARREFGAIRQLPSGRFQASYTAPDGRRRLADKPFATRGEASRWLAAIRVSLDDDRWVDPVAGKQVFAEYAAQWVRERAGLRPRTRDLYSWLLAKHVAPTLGAHQVRRITPAIVRTWRHRLLESGVSISVTAKSYRLLRAILGTAVEDGVIAANPCRIRGAGSEHADERPVLTIEQVLRLAAGVPERFEALVLVATFGSIRWGEAAGLRRQDVDQAGSQIRIRQVLIERSKGGVQFGPPKSAASVRNVALPGPVMEKLAAHLDRYVAHSAEALVFTGSKGAALRRSNFNSQADWARQVEAVGAPRLHFHDLRHTGNMLAAATPGATLRALMDRMGHSTVRAALIYQHAARGADMAIADGLTVHLQAASAAEPVARGLHAPRVRYVIPAPSRDGGVEAQGLRYGAGDENRTRTVSLGS